jgi:cobyrinic acid a,c-diamide synthase
MVGFLMVRNVKGKLMKCGYTIRVHEFHYYDSTDRGKSFIAQKPFSKDNWRCVHATDTLFAEFPHLFLLANTRFAENFIKKAATYA